MERYRTLLRRFARESARILGKSLVGVYLHGSAALGCFNPVKSDLDLLVVVSAPVPDGKKRTYMDMVVALDREAPAKGLELSLVRRDYLRPFVYPTPYELHYSRAHLSWYRQDPEDYVARMRGVDPDLAAHCAILRRGGIVLSGEPVDAVFGPVGRAEYLDSIWRDVGEARQEMAEHPLYTTLNLCRAAAYAGEDLVLSKAEGAEWALSRAPEGTRPLIARALSAYRSEEAFEGEPGAGMVLADWALSIMEGARRESGAWLKSE